MGRVAYGDESVRRAGVPAPVYLLGVYIADEDQSDLADALSVYVRQDGKLHWRDHTSRTKRVVCKTISEYSANYLVVAASPIPEGRDEERARQQALHCLSVMLEGDFGVDSLVLERRQRTQDEKDKRTISLAQRNKVLTPGVRLTHRFGHEDKRLWVPDQVIGALGDHRAGSDAGDNWSMIADRVRVEEIDPRR